jgi:hypothetical protein
MGGCYNINTTPPFPFNLKGKSQAVSPLPSIYLTVHVHRHCDRLKDSLRLPGIPVSIQSGQRNPRL